MAASNVWRPSYGVGKAPTSAAPPARAASPPPSPAKAPAAILSSEGRAMGAAPLFGLRQALGGRMILRRSRFTHVVALGGGRVLILHAVTQLRLAVDGEVERLLGCFDEPRSLPEDFPDLSRVVGYDVPTLAGCVAALLERGFLSEKTADKEDD